MEVGIRDLKARLSEHLDRVTRGEVITVTSRGRRVAQIVPMIGRDNVERGLTEGWIARQVERDPDPVARQRPLRGTPTSTELISRDRESAYHQAMRKHTTIDLDGELVAQAREALGTTTTTETVHAALAEVVRGRRRMGLLELQPVLTLTDLADMRRHRFAEEPAPYESDERSE